MLIDEIKQQINLSMLKSGKIPTGLVDEIKPRLPYKGLTTIQERTLVPYATVQGILSGRIKSISPNIQLVVNASIDVLVELWGNDVLNYIWPSDEN